MQVVTTAFTVVGAGRLRTTAWIMELPTTYLALIPMRVTKLAHGCCDRFPGRVLGPGHNSIVLGPDGQTEYIVYHAWDINLEARRMCVDQLIWTPSGPRCDGPTWTPQTLVSNPITSVEPIEDLP
jgi:hypothetical protein